MTMVSRWLWWSGAKISGGESSRRERSARRSRPWTSGRAITAVINFSGPAINADRATDARGRRAQSVSKLLPRVSGFSGTSMPRGTVGARHGKPYFARGFATDRMVCSARPANCCARLVMCRFERIRTISRRQREQTVREGG